MTGVRHISLLSFAADATAAQVAAVGEALATLPGQIPEIREYRFGPDLGLNADNASFAVVADFDSVDGYLVYRDHPAHQAVIRDFMRPILASRSTVQHTL